MVNLSTENEVAVVVTGKNRSVPFFLGLIKAFQNIGLIVGSGLSLAVASLQAWVPFTISLSACATAIVLQLIQTRTGYG